MSRNQVDCYCAFCRTRRSVFKTKHIGAFGVLLSFLLGLSLGALLFRSWDPLSLALVALFLIGGEILAQLRWRISLICRDCGFDPLLYMRDRSLAAERVKAHLEQRSKDPLLPWIRPLRLRRPHKTKKDRSRELIQKSI